jgi:PAS domain-containing protein
MKAEGSLEGRLRASQEYNRSIIEACPAPLIVVDSRWGLTDVNEATVKFLGRPRKQIVGSLLDSHFSISPEAAASMRRAFEGSHPSKFELVVKAGGTEERLIRFEASSFHQPDGEIRGLLVAGVG